VVNYEAPQHPLQKTRKEKRERNGGRKEGRKEGRKRRQGMRLTVEAWLVWARPWAQSSALEKRKFGYIYQHGPSLSKMHSRLACICRHHGLGFNRSKILKTGILSPCTEKASAKSKTACVVNT
jgi:hypothetical protein